MYENEKVSFLVEIVVSAGKALLVLDNRLQRGAKDVIPELAGDSEPKFIVKVVVLKMILLELLVPQRKILVMKEIMCQVVADIAKDATTVSGYRSVPVPEDDGVSNLPEGQCESDKKSRGHD